MKRSPKEPTPIDVIRNIRKEKWSLLLRLLRAYKNAFPVGERVAWSSGKHRPTGIVEAIYACGDDVIFRIHSDRSNKSVPVHGFRVLEAAGGGA